MRRLTAYLTFASLRLLPTCLPENMDVQLKDGLHLHFPVKLLILTWPYINLCLSANKEDTMHLCLRDLWHIQPSLMKGREGSYKDKYKIITYMNIWNVMPITCLHPLRVTVLDFFHTECTSTQKVLHMHTHKHICIKTWVVKKVRQKEKKFPFLFHNSFTDNAWTVGCKRSEWLILNVQFESNLHSLYGNTLLSKHSEEHCIIQGVSQKSWNIFFCRSPTGRNLF
jgi:hypothetical protein